MPDSTDPRSHAEERYRATWGGWRRHARRCRHYTWTTMVLLSALTLAACGVTGPIDDDPVELTLTLTALDRTIGSQGDTVMISGENIAGGANVTFGSIDVASVAVRDADGLPVTDADDKSGVEVIFVVPVVAAAQNLTVSVTVSQTTADDGTETDTLANAFSYLIDGVLEGEFLFDFSSADDVLDEQPDYISLPWENAGVTVATSTWARNGRVLRIEPYGPDNAFFAAVFDPVGERGDVTVLARLRDVGTDSNLHWMTGLGSHIAGDLTGTGTYGSASGLLTQLRTANLDGEGVIAANLDNGALGKQVALVSERGSYLLVRWTAVTEPAVTRLVSIKTWDGTRFDEPEAWLVEDLDLESTVNAGGVGITRFFALHASEIDWVLVNPAD